PRQGGRRAGHGRGDRAMRTINGTYAGNAVTTAARFAPRFMVPTLFALMVGVPAGAVDVEPITPIPRVEVDAAKGQLGRTLFHAPRLSQTTSLACASCHQLEQGGADGRSHPLGADARPLDFNSPSIFNVGLNYRLNWRVNFRALEEQNEAVLLDRRLM